MALPMRVENSSRALGGGCVGPDAAPFRQQWARTIQNRNGSLGQRGWFNLASSGPRPPNQGRSIQIDDELVGPQVLDC